MSKPTGRPRGRPKGSRDFRPRIIEFAKAVFKAEGKNWDKYFKTLSPKERLYFLKDVGTMALQASPKTVEGAGGVYVRLIISGLDKPKEIEGEVVEDVPALPEASPEALEEREPGALRPRRLTIQEIERNERQRAERARLTGGHNG